MHLALDFDNTIVCYEYLFHKIALEEGLISDDVGTSKVQVRDYLRSIGKEDVWTQMQGIVYGKRMLESDPYPNFLTSLDHLASENWDVSIVSHKTQYPYLGEKYDLHAISRLWVEQKILSQSTASLTQSKIHFEITKEAKIQRIRDIECDYFIDDLPEILLHDDFPESVKKILFDPGEHHPQSSKYTVMRDWRELNNLLGIEPRTHD